MSTGAFHASPIEKDIAKARRLHSGFPFSLSRFAMTSFATFTSSKFATDAAKAGYKF